MTKHELAIEGMHCDACVRRVTTALSSVPGVQVEAVQVGAATVLAGADVSPDALATAIRDAGFEPAALARAAR